MSQHRPLQQVGNPAPTVVPGLRTLGDFIDASRFRGHVFEVRHPNGHQVVGLGVYVPPDGPNLIDPHDGYSWFMSSQEVRATEVVRCLNATITYEEATP